MLNKCIQKIKGNPQISNQAPQLTVGQWEEAGAPGGNPVRPGENMQTLTESVVTNPGPSSCEATVVNPEVPRRHRTCALVG